MNQFQADIDAFILKCQDLSEAVIKEAAQAVIEDAQQSEHKGGLMPVDTGFLTNSGVATIDALPTFGQLRPKDYNKQDWDASQTVLTINRLKIGQTLYFSWTANYAAFMEYRYSFLRTAAQRWQEHVDAAANKLKG